MPLNIDAYLGVHGDALKVYARRSEVLASNLANADTPNYKARDVDFRSVLAASNTSTGASLPLAATHGAHLRAGAADGAGNGLKYRVPLAPALDGNTVDPQLEQAAFAENTVRYQAALSFLSDKFRTLMTAITGQ
jgi:flagellar basal-body rod protein FlgB